MISRARLAIFGGGIVAIAAVLLFGFRAFVPTDDIKIRPYKVAVLIAETGNFAFTGKPIRNVLELASAQSGADVENDDMQIEFVWADTQGNPREAVTAFNRVVEIDKVNAVITNLSGQTLAVAPLAKARSIPQFGITIDPAFLKETDLGFRFQFSAATEATQIEKSVAARKWKEVLILYSTDASTVHAVSRLLIPQLTAAGVRVVGDTFNPGQRDFGAVCAKYAANTWDGVIYHGFGNDIPFLAEACSIHPNILKAPKICAVGCLDAPEAQRKVLAGVQLVGPSFYSAPATAISQFREKYAAKYPGEVLPWHALYALDIYSVLRAALRNIRSKDPHRLKAELQKPHDGLTQQFQFDESGDVATQTTWLEFDLAGKIVPIAAPSNR